MKSRNLFLGAFALFATFSCTKDDSIDESKTPVGEDLYNIVWCASDENNTPSYVQSLSDLSSGIIDGSKAFETPSERSAYTFTSSNGQYLYNYSYGGGTFNKYAVKGGNRYTQVGPQLSTTDAIGSAYGRCSKLSDKFASAHNVVTTPQFTNGGATYSHTKAELKIAIIDLEEMAIVDFKTIELPRNAYDEAENTYVWRVHMPVIQGDKIYYGIARSRASASDPNNRDKSKGRAGVLVMDYPSLENPQILQTGLDVDGDTYGFRSNAMFPYGGNGANKDDMYQLSMSKSHILKIADGKYDDSYVFDLKAALGSSDEIKAAGWHYVGNGIAYVPFGLDNGGENNWGLARVDLNTKTAVRLNIPNNMDMWEYQSSRLEGDTLYMAICPANGDGHIYMFDINSTSADGFTLGAKLLGAAGAYYAGVF